MTDTAKNPEEGWGWPIQSRKAHYFSKARALCGKWLYMGRLEASFTLREKPGPDDCATCHKKLLKLRSPQPV